MISNRHREVDRSVGFWHGGNRLVMALRRLLSMLLKVTAVSENLVHVLSSRLKMFENKIK